MTHAAAQAFESSFDLDGESAPPRLCEKRVYSMTYGVYKIVQYKRKHLLHVGEALNTPSMSLKPACQPPLLADAVASQVEPHVRAMGSIARAVGACGQHIASLSA